MEAAERGAESVRTVVENVMRAFLFDSALARPLVGGALLLAGAPSAPALAHGASAATAGEIIDTAQKREQTF
jgi:hypothetical protein